MLIDTNYKTSDGKMIWITASKEEVHELVTDDKALEKYIAMINALKAMTGIDNVWIVEEE